MPNNTTSDLPPSPTTPVRRPFSPNEVADRASGTGSVNAPPTYQSLFGSDSYYTVDPWRSVLSPAAYFVALMKLREQEISGIAETDHNSLKSRRPDLWDVVLDEENTDSLTPKLDIVNEVLTTALGEEGNDLADKQYPFALPYNQSLEEIRQYLSQNGTSLPDIWNGLIPAGVLTAEETTVICLETLQLSPQQWVQYSTPNTTKALVNPFYGLPANDTPSTKLAPVDVFLNQTGLAYDQLTELLYEDLSQAEMDGSPPLQSGFFINAGTGAPIGIENARLQDLTVIRLDRIQRFVRLAQALNWSFTELDWALRTIGQIVNRGSPVINDDILPYLSWMSVLNRNNALSVDQCCALIGTLRDFGRENGATFFDQVFQNPLNPTPPQWVTNGEYDLKWSVPQPGADAQEGPAGKQIENALAAALQVSHDDLVAIANLVLEFANDNRNPLDLTLENLSILYRLSLLPNLTGLSIQEALVLADLLGLTEGLAGSSGSQAKSALVTLCGCSTWLETSPFSVYELQFVLDGASSDPAVQNKILGTDAISNFLSDLGTSIEKNQLTRDRFRQAATTDVQQVFSALLQNAEFVDQLGTALGETAATVNDSLNSALSHLPTYTQLISDGIYTELQTKSVDANGIVLVDAGEKLALEAFIGAAASAAIFAAVAQTTIAQKQAITEAVLSALFPPLLPPTPSTRAAKALLDSVAATLRTYYQSQQTTFINHLASLYHVSSQIGAVLKTIGDLNIDALAEHAVAVHLLGALLPADDPANSVNSGAVGIPVVAPILQQLQQAAELITALSLSPAEARYFDIRYPIKLEMVEAMVQFRQLIQIFQDTQNNLLNILEAPSASDQTVLAKQLSELSGWNSNRIEDLVTKLDTAGWLSSGPYSVAGVSLLQRYFGFAGQLGIDIENLWQLVQLSNSSTPQNQQNSAQALWAGLQAQYKDQLAVLTGIEGCLSETLRDKLVSLAMAALDVTTPRALYEHFLIDVEVSAAVQTSRVKEAISAVQLYIYRCLNHLEPGVAVDPELADLWTWMYGYREWQANLEVFLYPEDYIQPELRKHKTDLFAKAENDLKQANLADPDSVAGIFMEYMNGFAEVGNLQIVGSAVRDLEVDGIATKQFGMVGMTRQQPNRYYFRVATFVYAGGTGQYQPADWGQWRKVNIPIQPVNYGSGTDDVGAVTPVFAFGKWYVFWVEQKQTAAPAQSGTTVPPKYYTATVCYSHLDFSERWVAAQILTSIDLLTTPITAAQDSVVFPVYFASIQTLYIPYQEKLYQLTENALSQGVIAAFRYESANPPQQHPTAMNQSYSDPAFQYYPGPGHGPGSDAQSFATWFKVDAGENTPLWNFASVTPGCRLLVGGNEISNGPVIEPNTWYHLAYSGDGDNLYIDGEPVTELFQKLCVVTDSGLYTLQDGKWAEMKAPSATSQTRCLNNFNGTLYAGTDPSGLYALEDGTWKSLAGANAPPKSTVVSCLCNYNGITYVGTGSINASTSNGLYTLQDGAWAQVTGAGAPPVVNCVVTCLDNIDGTLYAATLTSGLYALKDGTWAQVTGKNAPLNGSYSSLCSFDDAIYVGTILQGLHTLQDGAWALVTGENAPPADCTVGCLYNFNGALYTGTLDSGLFALKDGKWAQVTGASAPPTDSFVRCLYNINGSLCVGTQADGLFLEIEGKWAQVTGTSAPPKNCTIGLYGIHGYGAVNPLPLSTKFSGATQETLFFDGFLNNDQVEALYQSSKDCITKDFEFVPTGTALGAPDLTVDSVLGQPNWSIIAGYRAEYLSVPYQGSSAVLLNCYRLNSTAVPTLEALLHRPAGIDALLSVAAQKTPEAPFANLDPNGSYIPSANDPSDRIGFTAKSATSNYYWELFFHLPFLIAHELQTEQNFPAARKWLEYIFNPGISRLDWDLSPAENPNDRFWRFLGLRSADNPALKQELAVSEAQQERSDLGDPVQLYEYDTDPYDPQEIASLRPIAYQKTILMHYVGILLAWGDMLFRQNTRESIVEAEMFYVMAYDLLGKTPQDLGPEPLPEPAGYNRIGIGVLAQKSGAPSTTIIPTTTDISCICSTEDTLYAGTTKNGLYCSNDGQTWSQVEAANAPSKSSRITCLYYSGGTLCAGTQNTGVHALLDGMWTLLGGSATGPIVCLCDYNGTLYAGTETHGLLILQNGAWTPVGGTGAASEFPCVICLSAFNGTLYAGTGGQGLLALQGETLVPVTGGQAPPPNAAVRCFYCFDDVLYAGTGNDGLYSSVDGQTWRQAPGSGDSQDVNCLSGFKGSLYMGTNGGLYAQRGDAWISVSGLQAFPAGFTVNCLYAFNGTLYTGTASQGLWAIGPYFGIPPNQQFLSYWSTVQQRLYDIRHSLTIDGQKDELPLFQPPINPMQLVAAVASGEGLAQAMQSLNSAIPYYRFSVMIEKAEAVTQTVIQLGQSLLSALEQKDAEQLAMLYNTNQRNILQLSSTSKQDQLDAAERNIQALQASLIGAQNRLAHYTQLIEAGLMSGEQKQISMAKQGISVQNIVEAVQTAAIGGYSAPVIFGFADGGMKIGDAINQGAGIAQGAGGILNAGSGLAGTVVSYQRRGQDWQLQQTMAQDDINQIQLQIVAAQYQQHLAAQSIAVLNEEIEQKKSVASFYLKKFTSTQLYQWYTGQVSALYFQAYQLAHDIALQAENAWKYEHIGRSDTDQSTDFIKPGYWNNLREGLLAGQSLQLDLQRMGKAFTDQNERRLEVEKTISLALLDPKALMDLKTNGSCVFDIAEKDFDFDFPGHFCRQIKSLSLSLPVMLSPYQNIHATLTQLANKIVTSDNGAGQQAVDYLLGQGKTGPGSALKVDVNPNQQIALSQGINDSGLFELNFNDVRYLPFEGTGAVSTWMLEMPLADNPVDFDSLTDVIIEMRYTALAGSAAFKGTVVASRGSFNGWRIFSLAQEFAPAWQEFMQGKDPQPLQFGVDPSLWRNNMTSFSVTGLSLYLQGIKSLDDKLTLEFANTSAVFSTWSALQDTVTANWSPANPVPVSAGTWTLKTANALPSTLENAILVVEYSADP